MLVLLNIDNLISILRRRKKRLMRLQQIVQKLLKVRNVPFALIHPCHIVPLAGIAMDLLGMVVE